MAHPPPESMAFSSLGRHRTSTTKASSSSVSLFPCLTDTWGDLPLQVNDPDDMLIYYSLHDAVSSGWSPFVASSHPDDYSAQHISPGHPAASYGGPSHGRQLTGRKPSHVHGGGSATVIGPDQSRQMLYIGREGDDCPIILMHLYLFYRKNSASR
ncbi:hypothetical protein SAY86_019507 [Trapa natans]|uniref:Uncharacterized protein n=1 Tax=Trapa natans TaxID=22666 RepID=A0AAN7LHF3_TRANT|nr:hypothetical protein SAY86_019507 [Trapa natans]